MENNSQKSPILLYIAEKTRIAWAEGKFDGVKVGRCKWYKYVKRDSSQIKVQGTWELAFVKWADEQGLKFDTHQGKLSYQDENGIFT